MKVSLICKDDGVWGHIPHTAAVLTENIKIGVGTPDKKMEEIEHD